MYNIVKAKKLAKSLKRNIQNKIRSKKAAATIIKKAYKTYISFGICSKCGEEININTCAQLQCGHNIHNYCMEDISFGDETPRCPVCKQEFVYKIKRCQRPRQSKSLKRLIQNRITYKIPNKKSNTKKKISFGKAKVKNIEKQNNGNKEFPTNLYGKNSEKVEEENDALKALREKVSARKIQKWFKSHSRTKNLRKNKDDEETDTDDDYYYSPLRKLYRKTT